MAFVVGAPTPYREPFFERLAESGELEIVVLYCRGRQPDQKWQLAKRRYPSRLLRNLSPVNWRGRFLISDINPDVCRELEAFDPSAVVVHGYNTLTFLSAVRWCKRRRIPVLMRSDSNILAEPSKAQHKLLAKRLFLGWLTRQITVVLALGTANSEYWQQYGAPPEKLITACETVDINYFRTEAARYRAERDRIRQENGWRSRFLLLYIGRLVPVKRVDILIEAVRIARAGGLDIGLLVVGDGVERQRLEEQACMLPEVHFLGFRDLQDLPRFYGISDIFVLPSEVEPWGFVVIEAMASGLPVVATRVVGAARDMVVEGKNGFLVPERNAEALATTFKRMCMSEDSLSALGKNAQVTSEAWSYSAAVEGINGALSYCFDDRERRMK